MKIWDPLNSRSPVPNPSVGKIGVKQSDRVAALGRVEGLHYLGAELQSFARWAFPASRNPHPPKVSFCFSSIQSPWKNALQRMVASHYFCKLRGRLMCRGA